MNPRITLTPGPNDEAETADLLYADGVLCVLPAAVTDQVGAVDPVDELRLCLEPLHGPRKPSTQRTEGAVKRKRRERREMNPTTR